MTNDKFRPEFVESVQRAQKSRFKKLMKKSIKEDTMILKALAGQK